MFGGATTTITATTSETDLLLTNRQVVESDYIELHSNIKDFAFTLTLPTAADLSSLMNGTAMTKTFWVRNDSGANATVTAGTGGIILEPDGQNVVIGTGNYAEITIKMLNSGKAYLLGVDEWVSGL